MLAEEEKRYIIGKNHNHDWGKDGFCQQGCRKHQTDWMKNNLCHVKINADKLAK